MAYGVSRDEILTANGYESITVADSSIGLTAAKALVAMRAIITAETAQMRFRYDGTAPESTEGHVLEAGDTISMYGTTNLQNFRAIRTGSTSGVLKVTYEAS